MAGRPIRRAMQDELDRMVRATFDEGTEVTTHSHLDLFSAWIESGKTPTQLAETIARSLALPIERHHVERHIRDTFPADWYARVTAARKIAADAYVERNQGIAETVEESRDAIAKAKLQIDQNTWLASRYNREQYGEQKQQVDVTVNVGALFLDSLRKREVGALTEIAAPALPASHTLTSGQEQE